MSNPAVSESNSAVQVLDSASAWQESRTSSAKQRTLSFVLNDIRDQQLIDFQGGLGTFQAFHRRR